MENLEDFEQPSTLHDKGPLWKVPLDNFEYHDAQGVKHICVTNPIAVKRTREKAAMERIARTQGDFSIRLGYLAFLWDNGLIKH